jgi:hypothetical protein
VEKNKEAMKGGRVEERIQNEPVVNDRKDFIFF